MSLKEYKRKRDFSKTQEPLGSKKDVVKAMRFCIQKHAARRLHYDFRLEYKGVLLSWAVPKGLSLNPQDKRLAIKVEDHPLDYQYFEGVIPKGSYGAGTVEIWDHGSFTTPHAEDRKAIEKELEEGLRQGHFIVNLHGDKLNGEFILQKLKKDPEDTSWLVIKKSDDNAVTSRIKENSVSSKKKTKKNPSFISPMLATLIKKPFNSEDWLFEVKWDGFRALAFVQPDSIALKSRNQLLLNEKFPVIYKSLQKIKGSAVLDGEIVVVDAKGKSHFQLIQNYQKKTSGTLCYYVFDILFKDGQDLREYPLVERKEILKQYLKQLDLPLIRYSAHVMAKGEEFFKLASKEHLEGIIGKKIDSTYQSKRSHDWVKIKTYLRQEIIICGFTEPRGSRQKLGALIAGIYNDKHELQFAGHVGGGFTESALKEVYSQLKPLIQKKCPFKKEPKVNTSVTWVEPLLIAEVSFSEWTQENIMRHPIFQGLRMDKDPKKVGKEIPESPPVSPGKGKTKKAEFSPTNVEKVYWPKEKYTKGDLLDYYENVAPYILPYLKNRPIILHRYPEGITKESFYQKDIKFPLPQGMRTTPIQHEEGKITQYLLIDDVYGLLYAVNLGSIDLHPFLSQIQSLDRPDYCVIDLDPHDIPFQAVIDVALELHDMLEKMKIKHFCKTSGGKGLHILIPLHAQYEYEQSKQFAEIICRLLHKKFPKTTSVERSPEKRPKKIYLDFLQNRTGQSIVAPYAVRPRPKAMVSTPLSWEEVNQDLDLSLYTIETIPARLKKKGDIFKGVLGAGIKMEKALSQFKNEQ